MTVAQAVETPPEALAIFSATLSPFCPGLTLAACPSPSADSLRAVIRAQVAAGMSREAITSALYRDYGDQIRAAPPFAGQGALAWLVPPIAVLVGAFAVARWVTRMRRQSSEGVVGQARMRDEHAPTAAHLAASPADAETARMLADIDAAVRRA